jgi:hypothetical protein
MAKKKILELRDLQNYWDQETIVLYCQECKVETTTFIIDANPPNIKHRFSGNNFTTKAVKPYIFHQDCQKALVLQEKNDGKYYDIMKERLLKVDRDPIPLPSIEKPTSLIDAELKIKQLHISLDRSNHEHAFKFGVYFAWVKKNVGHGKFGRWIEVFTRWSDKTVERYMTFAEECIKADQLLIYRPSAAKIDSMTNLPDPDPEAGTPAVDAMLDKPEEEKPKELFVWTSQWSIDRIKQVWMEVTDKRSVDDREAVLVAVKAIVEREEKNIEFLRLPKPPVEQVDCDFNEWVGVDDEEHEPPLTDEEIIKIFNEVAV